MAPKFGSSRPKIGRESSSQAFGVKDGAMDMPGFIRTWSTHYNGSFSISTVVSSVYDSTCQATHSSPETCMVRVRVYMCWSGECFHEWKVHLWRLSAGQFLWLGCYWYVLVGFFFGQTTRRTTLSDSFVDHCFSTGRMENGLISTLQWWPPEGAIGAEWDSQHIPHKMVVYSCISSMKSVKIKMIADFHFFWWWWWWYSSSNSDTTR